MSDYWGFETKQIHVGGEPDPTTGARAVPIYQTTSYEFRDTDHAANLFGLAEVGNIYTRIMNPTQAALEARVTRSKGGCTTAIGIPGHARRRIGPGGRDAGVHDAVRVGRPRRRLAVALRRHLQPAPLHAAEDGHRGHLRRRPRRPRRLAGGDQPNTKVFFGEVLPNPKNDFLDIEGVAGVAHDNGIPLIVDNTVPTPYLVRPLEWGADIVVHCLTKFIGGHGTSIGGAIVDGGTFDYGASGRFPNFTEPDPSYHGLAYFPALGHGAFILKARVQMLRDLGMAISPFNAFLILQGLETLSLRMERHFANAQKVAEYLDGHDQVESVNYAGLASSPWHERASKLGGGKGYGSVLAFEIEGGLEAGKKFVEGAELHSHVANIGDVRSLVIHPASTTHSQLTPEEQAASDVTAGLVRLSVGLESIDDILADLDTGFAALRLTWIKLGRP